MNSEADKIRNTSWESSAYLREIAAQLAELNRKLTNPARVVTRESLTDDRPLGGLHGDF